MLLLTGCGEPSVRELKNRRELEALLTAISLRNTKELDKDIQRIEDRHNSGELSDASYKDLQEIARKAQGGNWVRPRNRHTRCVSRSRFSTDRTGVGEAMKKRPARAALHTVIASSSAWTGLMGYNQRPALPTSMKEFAWPGPLDRLHGPW